LELWRTREKRVPIQSGVVGLTAAKLSPTVAVCVAVIGNMNVIKAWTAVFGQTKDCPVLLFGLQRGFFSVKRKLLRLGSALEQLSSFPFHFLDSHLCLPEKGADSHSTGVNPPKMFPSVSKITVSVFACPSQRL
jgi:hypothetical protein